MAPYRSNPSTLLRTTMSSPPYQTRRRSLRTSPPHRRPSATSDSPNTSRSVRTIFLLIAPRSRCLPLLSYRPVLPSSLRHRRLCLSRCLLLRPPRSLLSLYLPHLLRHLLPLPSRSSSRTPSLLQLPLWLYLLLLCPSPRNRRPLHHLHLRSLVLPLRHTLSPQRS